MAFIDEIPVCHDADIEAYIIDRRFDAVERYGDTGADIEDARIVGYVLQGDKSVIEYLMHRMEEGIDRWDFLNPCLWSLLETFLTWRKHAAAGRLKSHIPSPAPLGIAEDIFNLRDFLELMDMFGEGTEYEYLSQSKAPGAPAMDLLPGWTLARLAELYAITTEPADIYSLSERMESRDAPTAS